MRLSAAGVRLLIITPFLLIRSPSVSGASSAASSAAWFGARLPRGWRSREHRCYLGCVRAPLPGIGRGLVRGLVRRLGHGLIALAALASCNDLRDFRGSWEGPRVGDDPTVLQGAVGEGPALLTVNSLDRHGLRGHLFINGAVDAPIESIPGAEADALAGMTFDGSPLRVYLVFADMAEGDDALTVISLHEDDRIDVRMLRGGATPLYAIFSLERR